MLNYRRDPQLIRDALLLARDALDVPTVSRSRWIDECCAANPQLRDEVISLLAQESAPPQPFEPEAQLGDTSAEADPLIGQRLGPYRVLERIGSGGMGAVYRGEPEEGVTRCAVALKLIKRGMDSEEILQRFLREREILAWLEHPNICRLLDGGISESGQPWFAMELVDGESLSCWCDNRQLPLVERVRLFTDVCAAVSYAHRNLVVHRDLKPGNVRVTREGVVKLLDFGIAKLLEPGEGSRSRAPMTPEYAAPEQLVGRPVTTQTDVFQLGALLQELLSGMRPVPLERDGNGQWRTPTGIANTLRAKFREQPEWGEQVALDRGGSTQLLLRRLGGDLGRILRRATHPDPERRYAGAMELCDDLNRWLRGEPVEATADSWSYRLSCFVRRHRVAVMALAAVMLSLLVGIGLSVHEAGQARIAEHRAEHSLEFLESLFLGADPYSASGPDVRVVDVLAKARQRLNAEVDADPAMAARLLLAIGATEVSLDNRTEAEATLRDALVASARAGEDGRIFGAAARARLAHYQLVIDGNAKALPELERSIAVLRDSGDEGRYELAVELRLYADYLFNTGQYDRIPAVSSESLENVRMTRGKASSEYVFGLAYHCSMLRAVGKPQQALTAAREAVTIMGGLGGRIPVGVRLYAQQQYAGALADLGRANEAEPVLRRTLVEANQSLGQDASMIHGIKWELASVQWQLGDFDAAYAQLESLRGQMDGQKGANVAGVLNGMGSTALGGGHAALAIPPLIEARDILCAGNSSSPPCLVIRLNLLDAQMAHGENVTRELDLLGSLVGEESSTPRLRWVRLDARWLRLQGHLDEAWARIEPAIDDALRMDEPKLEQGYLFAEASELAESRGQFDAALDYGRRAEEIMASTWKAEPPALSRLRQRIADLQARGDQRPGH